MKIQIIIALLFIILFAALFFKSTNAGLESFDIVPIGVSPSPSSSNTTPSSYTFNVTPSSFNPTPSSNTTPSSYTFDVTPSSFNPTPSSNPMPSSFNPTPSSFNPSPSPPPPPQKNEVDCGAAKWVRSTTAIPIPNLNVWLLKNKKTGKITSYTNIQPNALPQCGGSALTTFNALTENKISVMNALETYSMTAQASGAYTLDQKNKLASLLTNTIKIIGNNQTIVLN